MVEIVRCKTSTIGKYVYVVRKDKSYLCFLGDMYAMSGMCHPAQFKSEAEALEAYQWSLAPDDVVVHTIE